MEKFVGYIRVQVETFLPLIEEDDVKEQLDAVAQAIEDILTEHLDVPGWELARVTWR